MKRIYLGLLVLLLALLAACDGGDGSSGAVVTSLDFDRVCKGEPLATAPAYDPAAAGIHHVIVMSDSTIGQQYDEFFTQFISDMPEGWEAPLVDGTYDYSRVELVACISRIAAAQVDSCEFEDGYFLNIHDTSYEMILKDVRSGTEIARTAVELKADCPMLHMFDEGEMQEPYYPVVEGKAILAFIEPHVVK